jgi:hypothetical protein
VRAAVRTPGCSSLYGFTEFRQDNSFLIVAERTNANGSKKFKKLLDASDWDGLVSMAKEEMRDGSHLLDVCVDFVGRDGVKDMAEVASRYVQHVNAPLMVDSTQADVIEAALKRAGGRCIVNSINLEDGERRLDEICPLLRRYGAACVALTIDEDPQAGMAKTADRKLEIASRIHDLFTRKWGLDEDDLFFDPLTFTIATGNEEDRRLGLETLEGIRRISERFPRCQILLGLSNISFGLKPAARAVLNSAFLHEARARGLTAAIVHASKILPQNRIPREQWDAAMWLIFYHAQHVSSTLTYPVSGDRFARPDFVLHYRDKGQAPSRASLGLPAGDWPGMGTLVVCEGGVLLVEPGGQLQVWIDGVSVDWRQIPGQGEVRGRNHWHAWVNRIMGKDDAFVQSPFQYAAGMAEAGLLCVRAARFPGQELRWDRSTASITNHDEANRTIVRRTYRAGFELPAVT